MLEDRFLPLLRKHGLPTPRINVHVAGNRVDAYFPDHALVVELTAGVAPNQGALRQGPPSGLRDPPETGIPTVRLPSEDVIDRVIASLGELLDARAASHQQMTQP